MPIYAVGLTLAILSSAPWVLRLLPALPPLKSAGGRRRVLAREAAATPVRPRASFHVSSTDPVMVKF